jgi:hypothetical protein
MSTRLPILGALALRDTNIGYALIDFAEPNRCELKLPGAATTIRTAESLLTVATSPKRVRGIDGRLALTASNTIPYTYGIDGKVLGALIEPASTNLATNSAGGTSLTLSEMTRVTAQHVGPLGAVDMSKLIPSAVSAVHNAYSFIGVGATLLFAGSAFLRAGEITRVSVEIQNNASVSTSAIVDLISGAIVSSSGAIKIAMERYGDDLWRVHAAHTLPGGSTSGGLIFNAVQGTSTTFTGDGIGGFFIGGVQIEVDAGTPSSYIVTAGSSVARPADSIKLPSATLASIVPNAFEGTLIVETYPVLAAGAALAIWRTGGDFIAHSAYSLPGSGVIEAKGYSFNAAYSADFTTTSGSVPWAPGIKAQSAYRWSNTRRAALAAQTGTFGTDTTVRAHPLASSFNELILGHGYAVNSPSVMGRALIINRGLSDNEIRALLA